MPTPNRTTVTQTITKAAAKTFIQAFMAVFAPLSIAVLSGYVTTVQDGGQILFDLTLWTNLLLGGVAGGVAGLISLVWNWAKQP